MKAVRILAGDAAWSQAAGLLEPAGGAAAALGEDGTPVELGSRSDITRRHPSLPVDTGPGLLMPGLVDAHAHLELGALAGRVPGGDGLGAWVRRLLATRSEFSTEQLLEGARQAAASMRATGTTAVADVCTLLATAPVLEEAGLSGASLLEVVGASADAATQALAEARERQDRTRGSSIPSRLVPHSTYGTTPAAIGLLAEENTLSGARGVASIHVAEQADEEAWSLRGGGPFAPFLLSRGAVSPGRSSLSALRAIDAVGPGSLLVHLVTASPEELRSVGDRGAVAVLCPRSNLHIGGLLPDLGAVRSAGLRFALGTDSLASTPDHDLLGEVAALLEAFPAVPAADLLAAATDASALGLGPQPWVRSDSRHLSLVLARARVGARASA